MQQKQHTYSRLLGDLPGFVRWYSGWPWGRRAKDLMTSCGAQQIGALTWRGSYALIGVKDGTAWAEAIAIAGDGMAVAVAVVPWQELPPEMLPWCDTKAPMLATKGEMHSSGNLEIHAPSGKCRYQVFEEESAKTCFSANGSVDLLLCQSETDFILTCSIQRLHHIKSIYSSHTKDQFESPLFAFWIRSIWGPSERFEWCLDCGTWNLQCTTLGRQSAVHDGRQRGK